MNQKSDLEYAEVDRVLARKPHGSAKKKVAAEPVAPVRKRGPVKMSYAKVVVNFDIELYHALYAHSQKIDRSMSWLVRDIMRKQYNMTGPKQKPCAEAIAS